MKTCPYHSSYNNYCNHKQGSKSRFKKRYCGYKDHTKCPYYIEWLKAKESFNREAENGL